MAESLHLSSGLVRGFNKVTRVTCVTSAQRTVAVVVSSGRGTGTNSGQWGGSCSRGLSPGAAMTWKGPGVQGRASRSSHCGLCPREAWEFGACGEREVGGGWCSRPLRLLGEASPSDRGPRSSGHQQQ